MSDVLADLNDTRNECHNHGLHGCAADVQRAIEEIERLRREKLPMTESAEKPTLFDVAYGALKDAYAISKPGTAINEILETALNRLHSMPAEPVARRAARTHCRWCDRPQKVRVDAKGRRTCFHCNTVNPDGLGATEVVTIVQG